MTPIQLIEQALTSALVDEDGNTIELELLAGLSKMEIGDFQAALPCVLPEDVSDLLQYCRGFYGSAVDVVDFTGNGVYFEQQEIFPHGVPIASDGYGNAWVVDLSPNSSAFGPLYFACHDAPVILFQCSDLSDFLIELFKLSTPPFKSLLDDVHEDRVFNIWRKNPGVLLFEQALASDDSVVRKFARQLDQDWSIIDLRGVAPGFGFSWGRYGLKTEIRRFGYEPIFAYKRTKGILSRLFG